MKKKYTLPLMILLLLTVIGGYLGLKAYNKNAENAEDTTPAYTIKDMEVSKVEAFTLENKNGTFSFTKKGDSWSYDADTTMKLDNTIIEGMLENAVHLTSDDQITEVSDLSQYGLTEPQNRITIQTADDTYTWLIGDFNDMISKYYACIEGENTVYTTDSSSQYAFEKTAEDLQVVEASTEESTTEAVFQTETEASVQTETEASVQTEAETAAQTTEASTEESTQISTAK